MAAPFLELVHPGLTSTQPFYTTLRVKALTKGEAFFRCHTCEEILVIISNRARARFLDETNKNYIIAYDDIDEEYVELAYNRDHELKRANQIAKEHVCHDD